MFQRILIVCVGNICRSPTAEIVLRHRLPAMKVSSAGIGALRGRPMDATALDVLAEHGLDGRAHVARQIDEAMIRQADLILAMQQTHIDAITRRAPHARGRTMLLGKWQSDREIDDPYRRPRAAFEQAYQAIDATLADWLPHLRPPGS